MPGTAARRLTLAAAIAGIACPAPAVAAGPPPGLPGKGAALHRADAPRPAPAAPRADPSSVLVRLRAPSEAAAVARDHGASIGRPVPGTRYRLVRTGRERLRALRGALAGDPRVAAVEPNHLRSVAAAPTDPFFRKSGAQAYLESVRAPLAWTLQSAGAGSVVAVVDTGVDARHPDLQGRVLPGRDVVDGDTVAEDPGGHGTMVAGIAAALTGNGRGIAGVAPGASVLPVRVLEKSGWGTDADVATGIVWAADQGADVINVSLGAAGDSRALRDAVAYATGRGALVVAAAGNAGSRLAQYPAALPGVLAVGATDVDGNVAGFSSAGPWVDLVAPGVEILSTDMTDREDGPGVPYAIGDGTSFAAPFAAAAALLVRARHPGWAPLAVAGHLKATAADRGQRGADDHYGAGGLDIAAALGAAARPVVAPPAGDRGTDDAPTGAVALPLGEPGAEATLSPEGDVDFHAVRIDAPGWYFADAGESDPEDPDHPSVDLDAQLEVLDPELRPIARADAQAPSFNDVRGETAYFYARTAGRHLVRVSTGGGGRPRYSVRVAPGRPTQADARFLPYERFRGHEEANGAAVADVTGDGRPDALTGTEAGLAVHSQDGSGWLRASSPLPAHGVPGDVAAGDLNGDGDADVALTTSAGIDVFRQGTRGLGPPALIARERLVLAEIRDLDGNGRPEILAAGEEGIFRYAAASGGGWTATQLATGGVTDLEVGDVTGDGRLDLVTTDYWTSAGILVRAQRADRTFAPAVRYSGASSFFSCCEGLEVADVTGDGRQDAVVTQGGHDGTVAVLAQTPTGTLGYPAVYATPNNPTSVEAADVDGDGRRDVVAVHSGWETVSVLLQQPDGRLGARHFYGLPYVNTSTRGLAIADISSDGAADLVVAADHHGLAVLRQNSPGTPVAPAAWVRSTAPATRATRVDPAVAPTITFGRALDPASATASTVRLADASTGASVAASLAYDAGARKLTVRPSAALPSGRTYAVRLSGLRDTGGARLPDPYVSRFTVGVPPVDGAAPDTRIARGPERRSENSGYFRAVASEPHSRYECSREEASGWHRCDGHSYSPGTGNGPELRTIRVRAVDAAGRADPTPATRTYRVVDPEAAPNDRPDEATVLPGTSGRVTGSNFRAFKWPSYEPSPGDNGGGAMVWWRWTAPASRTATFSTAGSDFDTLLGAYTWTESFDDPMVPVAENDDATSSRTTSRVTFTAQAGRTYWIAVDGFNASANNAEAQVGEAVLTYNAAEPPTAARVLTGLATATTASAATLNGTADAGGVAGSHRFEYGPTTAYGTRTAAVDGGASALPRAAAARVTGLQPDREYHYRLLFTTAAGATVAGEDQTLRTRNPPPAVSTLAATEVRPGSALLNGRVTGGEGTRYGVYFEYGPTTAYGSTLEPDPALGWPDLAARTTRLAGATTYHYRLVAEHEEGARVLGADRTFTTPARGAPAIESQTGGSAEHDSASVTAYVDPNGAATSVWVEYGTTTAYGSRGPAVDAGLGTEHRAVDLRLAPLKPVTDYHYRVVAANAAGTTRSADATLTTRPPPPVVTALAPTEMTPTAVTVNGRIDPGGLPTTYGFAIRRWPPSEVPLDPWLTFELPAATGAQAVAHRGDRLTPDTEYVLEIAAVNGSGHVHTPLRRFRTPQGAPLVSPWSTDVTAGVTTARIDTLVNPAGPLTTVWYEYGKATVGERTTTKVTIGSGSVDLHARGQLTGLAASTTYRYRIVASNALGTTRGATGTFTTHPAP